MKRSFARVAAAFVAVCAIVPALAAAPSYVDITWFSISNLYLQVGPLGIIVDGYITRIPASAFFGGGGGLAGTHQAYTPDVAGVTRVLTALGGPSSVKLLLTGHSHFDHSFDTATWSKLTPDGIGINALTSERLTDLGGGPTFYSCLVEVERVDASKSH